MTDVLARAVRDGHSCLGWIHYYKLWALALVHAGRLDAVAADEVTLGRSERNRLERAADIHFVSRAYPIHGCKSRWREANYEREHAEHNQCGLSQLMLFQRIPPLSLRLAGLPRPLAPDTP